MAPVQHENRILLSRLNRLLRWLHYLNKPTMLAFFANIQWSTENIIFVHQHALIVGRWMTSTCIHWHTWRIKLWTSFTPRRGLHVLFKNSLCRKGTTSSLYSSIIFAFNFITLITFSHDDLKTLLFEYVQCLILGLTFRRDILNNSSYLTSMSQSVLQRSLFLELIIT